MAAEGLLLESRPYSIPLGLSQRTGEPVEPILSTQWWFKMSEVAPAVLEGLEAGDMQLTPERYTKVNRDWLTGLRDWNISRQLWWGHQIPAWYDAEGEVYAPDPATPYLDPPDDPRFEGLELTQDSDVFDTWFSSNLWPFSTLGCPTRTTLFQKVLPDFGACDGLRHPLFWVTKMQLAATASPAARPFTTSCCTV